MRCLLVTPPMVQLNTPYPATAYLTGFLRQHGVDVVQADPALTLFLRLFSRDGLERVLAFLKKKRKKTTTTAASEAEEQSETPTKAATDKDTKAKPGAKPGTSTSTPATTGQAS